MNPDNHTWDLLVGALKGTLGEAEQREFDRWAAEAENRRFYNNLTRVWREIQQRAAAYEPDRDRLWSGSTADRRSPATPVSPPGNAA